VGRAIDHSSDQRLIEFFGEEPFAARFAQRSILCCVARRADSDNFEIASLGSMRMR
jgi:hypothetical protein